MREERLDSHQIALAIEFLSQIGSPNLPKQNEAFFDNTAAAKSHSAASLINTSLQGASARCLAGPFALNRFSGFAVLSPSSFLRTKPKSIPTKRGRLRSPPRISLGLQTAFRTERTVTAITPKVSGVDLRYRLGKNLCCGRDVKFASNWHALYEASPPCHTLERTSSRMASSISGKPNQPARERLAAGTWKAAGFVSSICSFMAEALTRSNGRNCSAHFAKNLMAKIASVVCRSLGLLTTA